jgi:glycosyltransferase involved in cell wall biosynthesis
LEAATAQDVGPAPRMEHGPKEASVICTAKNAAATIERTIRSILAQDFQNWEMIIVDDGSSDDTISIVRTFARADARIRLVTTGGIGRGLALNRALTEAEADLVANIDADDEVHPALLRCHLQAMQQHPQFAVIGADWFLIYGAEQPSWAKIDESIPFEVRDMTDTLALHNAISHSSVVMRKAAIVALGGYDETRRAVIDYELWVRCAAAGLRIGVIQLPLAAHRIHAGQWFRHSPRLHVLLTSLRTQARAMRALGMKRYLPLLAVGFVWGVLPSWIRLGLRDLGSYWRVRHRGLK